MTRAVEAPTAPGRDAERFRATFEQAAVGMAHVALDGHWLRVNRKLCAIVGYSEEELLGRTFQDITHAGDLDADLAYVRQLLAGEIATYAMEKRYIRKDGATAWINLTASLVRDASGQPEYFIAVVEDIGRRKRAEDELALAHRNLRLIAAVNSGLVRAEDTDTLLRDNCRAAVTVGGYRMAWIGQAEDAPGKPVRPLAWAGAGAEGYLAAADITWADEPRGRGPTGRAIRAGTPQLSRFIFTDPAMAPWRELAARHGFASSCALPLRVGDDIFGALVLHAAEPDAFGPQELELLQQMTADIGFGLGAQRAQAALRSIEWMLSSRAQSAAAPPPQPYGDLTALNTGRTILDAVGKDLLHDIVSDYMDLLETSSAVYEKNGDYAYGIFTSGWCQAMDYASYRGCGTGDARGALGCGKWHCHESCWNEASRKSMEIGGPTDIACAGGIRLHAVPIVAGDEIVGSINFGYGSPPRDEARLGELSAKYGLPVDELRRNAAEYRERPPFVIELAKRRLLASARLIGEIVQRKRAQEALRELNASLEQRVVQRTVELESTNKELEAFAYSVSHDLRVPLRAVDGFAHMLEDGYAARLDDEGRRLLTVVRHGAQRMGQLIDDVLTFSRLSRRDMDLRAVDMAAAADEAIRELAPLRQGRQLDLRVGALPVVRGDAAMLRQVWLNLLANAIKFTGPRAVAHIEAGGRQEGAEAVYWVKDDGVGFDMQYAGKLFGVFQRLHAVSEFEGTGTGLAIAKRIVTRHGGRVWAESRLGEGATFWFALPAAARPQPKEPAT